MRKKIIKTNNKELYNKLSMLKFFPEVVINGNGKERYIGKIVKSLNEGGKVIDIEKVGKYIILKKRGALNFEIYYR